ncbi:DUF3089 domain-containing protein [Roseibacterium beibuensis]|uniref:DUF3089 domain-containing protein n=1 Tax=[Roseibacterium] beibuensis TaxID=1193142 RepID=UPI00217D8184|nr:DUF3089 domain-containing protein [Roseibacterium beibuensis]MCS6625233.1 DUF3089 domain-containing protein [Roseibacterium beibuensis]
MSGPKLTARQWTGWIGFALVFLLTAAVAVWRGDILRAGLDPQVPFQTYQPPPAPDYSKPAAWALSEARAPEAGPAAIFFVHSTTYDGGRHWNGPIGHADADAWLTRVVLPNYAGPFARLGAVSAPRYRQGSLYTRLTLRDDAREARAFAYRDVAAAFEAWIARHPDGPIILAGVEQGGELIERLLRERVATDPGLRDRLAAAYLMDVVAPADGLSPQIPACGRRDQAGCVVGFSPVSEGNDGAARRRLRRALVWDERGRLIELEDREALCVNPVTGSTSTAPVTARQNRGATNATGLEWGARPALLAREIATQCRGGLLRYSEPDSESFRQAGDWADRRKSRPYNLFYGDLEADAEARLAAWRAGRAA